MQGNNDEYDDDDAISVSSHSSNISDASEVPERTREQAKAEA
jgi:hypothetical protein